MNPVFTATVLEKYPVEYVQCTHCSLLQTESPYWLEEAYSDAIADCDTGIMERNFHNALRVSAVVKMLGLQDETILDFAGGYGVLTRLLRDMGYDCRWSDKYCENIMAKGFLAEEAQRAKVLCAMEVLEHIENPLCFLQDAIMENESEVVVFTTEEFKTLPHEDWWYFSRETGQHITFYSVASLEELAEKIGWHYIRLPRHMHLFSARPISWLKKTVLKSYGLYFYAIIALLSMRKYSKTFGDSIASKGA